MAGWAHLSCEERVSEEEVRQGGEPCLQHCSQRERKLALECRESDESQTVGMKAGEDLGGLQEEVVVGDESQMEKT